MSRSGTVVGLVVQGWNHQFSISVIVVGSTVSICSLSIMQFSLFFQIIFSRLALFFPIFFEIRRLPYDVRFGIGHSPQSFLETDQRSDVSQNETSDSKSDIDDDTSKLFWSGVCVCRYLRQGWVLLKRTSVFIEIQFTRHFIDSEFRVFVETKKIVTSNSNVISTWQTCDQRLAAGGKRRALAFYFPVRICYMFLISKCRRQSDLGLRMTSGFAKRMRLRSADLRRILNPNNFPNRNLWQGNREIAARWTVGV